MSKYFKNFPSEFKKHNPKALPAEWYGRDVTLDEKGRLHSHNDEPIYSKYKGRGEKTSYYSWYSHGNMVRKNKKPVAILAGKTLYATYDKDKELHSYKGKPAYVEWNVRNNTFILKWYKNGLLHRDDNLPAIIEVNSKGQTQLFFVDGVPHRANSLPAKIKPQDQAWLVKGFLHNSEGLAWTSSHFFPVNTNNRWGLYGVQLPEEIFDEVKTLQAATNFPLWTCLFSVLGFYTKETLKDFMQANGEIISGMPIIWVLRSLGISEETFKFRVKSLGEQHIAFWDDYNVMPYLQRVIKIIEFEEQEALVSS